MFINANNATYLNSHFLYYIKCQHTDDHDDILGASGPDTRIQIYLQSVSTQLNSNFLFLG